MTNLNPEMLETIKNLAAQVCERESCILYDIEWVGSGYGRILRIYIDKPTGGVSVDDCANVSRGLNLLLDVEDIIPGGAYELEVSSPGIERKLTQKWHYEQAVGRRIKLRCHRAVEAQNKPLSVKSLEGDLVRFEDDKLFMNSNNSDWEIPRDNVQSAHIVFSKPENSVPRSNKKR